MTSLPDVFQLLDAVLHVDVNEDESVDVDEDVDEDVDVDGDEDADVDELMDVANGNVYNFFVAELMNDVQHDAKDSFVDLYDSLLI